MKKWFDNQSIKKKILYGFGAVLILLTVVSILSFTTISTASSGFEEYRSTAINTNIVGRVQSNLLTARLDGKNFIQTSNVRFADEFAINFALTEKFAKEAYDKISDPKRKEMMGKVVKNLDDYENGFNQVVELVQTRNDLVYDLGELGNEIIDEELIPRMNNGSSNAGNGVAHMLIARLFVMKFTENSAPENAVRVNAELEKAQQFFSRIGSSSLQAKKDEYVSKTKQLFDTINKRDDIIVNTLDRIGPEIAELTSELKLDIKAHQDELGPALQASNSQGNTFVIIIALIAIAAGIGFSFIISKAVTGPIEKAYGMMLELGKGKLSARMNLNTNDEIGQMGRSMDKFADQLTGFSSGMDKVANGDLTVNVEKLSDEDELTPSFQRITATLRDLDNEIGEMIEESQKGNLKHRGNASKFQGGFRELVGGFNNTLDGIVNPIQETNEVMRVMATGDLTPRIEGNYQGDFATLKNNVNNLGDSLSKLIKEVTEAVQATATASNQISSSSEEMAAGAEEQNAQANEVASAVEEMTKTIFQNAGNASRAADSSKTSNDNAQLGSKKVQENKESIERITSAAETTGQIIASLAGKTDKIGEITQVIDDIADQTNLLALNAAIEAARAGEQGRGFAVVADEVRKLAERTTSATKEIAETIKAIQTEAKDADSSMVEAGKSVMEGKKITEELEVVLTQILESASSVALEIEQVASASEEQSTTSEQISKNIEAISTVTNETSTGIQQIARASEEMNRLTENLQHLTSRFKIALATEAIYSEEPSATGYMVSGNGHGNNGSGRLLTI